MENKIEFVICCNGAIATTQNERATRQAVLPGYPFIIETDGTRHLEGMGWYLKIGPNETLKAHLPLE